MFAPLVEVTLASDLVSGKVIVGVVNELPVPEVDMILGNDLAGRQVLPLPVLSEKPVQNSATVKLVRDDPDVFPSCAVTRAMSRKRVLFAPDEIVVEEPEENILCEEGREDEVNLGETIFGGMNDDNSEIVHMTHHDIDNRGLAELQRADKSLVELFKKCESREDQKNENFVIKNGLLVRNWVPIDTNMEDVSWRSSEQIVIPEEYRQEILSMAHDAGLSGHLGVRKTLARILSCFFWPGLKRDVAEYCRTCDTCQRMGKPNQSLQVAPLIPIPHFGEPFDRVVIDIVGPLPKTSAGYMYILTIMDMATRYPEAIPLRNISARVVVRELIKFFTHFGLPKEIQSDQGSNFQSKLFKQVMRELEISQVTSTAYHPQSQGAIERFHQTLKSMLKKYCKDSEKEWDKGLPYVLFAIRETPNESLGFSPFELMFGHTVKGPLRLVKERWMNSPKEGLLNCVTEMREKLKRAWELAACHLSRAQSEMKTWYDRKARMRNFEPGDEVLVLLPLQGQPLAGKFQGPYKIIKRVSDVNYVIATPDKGKSQRMCHINMLKSYHRRRESVAPVSMNTVSETTEDECEEKCVIHSVESVWNREVDVWEMIEVKLAHLEPTEKEELSGLLNHYQVVFRSSPGKTSVLEHDVDVGDAVPVKQRPYRVQHQKADLIRNEISYMLEHDLVEPCQSEWSSPVTLVQKSSGSVRFCIDYRKVNAVTKTDTYPMPRVDECVDTVGSAKFITKLDLLKGFWQVPLSERAREISCFVTLGQSYRCKVMPFGMKNSSATFQRLMNIITNDLEGCVTYIDDVIIYSDSWEEHLVRLEKLLERLEEVNLVVNLGKCEFGKAKVEYLGYIIGQGTLLPPQAKIEAICDFPRPQSRKEVQRLLGMVGYYRMFIVNFASVVAPLTSLLCKDTKYEWTPQCESAFAQLKAILSSSPILMAPNFKEPFKLAVDASKLGAGAVLMQEDESGVEHPVCYYSKKFNKSQLNYSVIEKELLALILGLQHFDVYIGPSGEAVTVYTDHHPLKYLSKFRNKNQRLTRWSLYLQEYNLDIIHVKGKHNILADCLSRGFCKEDSM